MNVWLACDRVKARWRRIG